ILSGKQEHPFHRDAIWPLHPPPCRGYFLPIRSTQPTFRNPASITDVLSAVLTACCYCSQGWLQDNRREVGYMRIVIIILSILLSPAIARAAVYKCRVGGTVVYTDQACLGHGTPIKVENPTTASVSRDA